ncbi:kinase-like domain-containing protein [Mycotypha africana]|uniref:kinase-like domain-containing protein n=1 Tax=Mycotypha africana TaxID=64632 RepID=UPI002300B22B|nr:kinase-like domain-containing protein [Mycotypha africana]KAI8973739.1 kinase-like domain-containing protein [Mycotypha africana]
MSYKSNKSSNSRYSSKTDYNYTAAGNETDSDELEELEVAHLQEASRLYKSFPSISDNIRLKKKKDAPVTYSSPYYCQEVGPQLDLGYQWPMYGQSMFQGQDSKKKSGFIHLRTSSDHAQRQKLVDRVLLSRKRQLEQQKNSRLILSMTTQLGETFQKHNPKRFNNERVSKAIPKRILTKPSKAVRNEENDNENHDYILKVNEILGHDPNYQYRVIDLLGQGTFGQVVKCQRVSTGELFSVKLNKQLDPNDEHHILRLHHVFSHKNHLCLVFELLSYNLYDLIGHNRYRGFPVEKVRAFAVQILDTLCLLKKAKIIHCDLKPENILLVNEKSLTIKVIDFGSSCHEANRIYTYIQSRFYRSPEVILGMRYTSAIDMWSFGCIVAELYLGLPLFPGSSEYNQLFRIVETLGIPSKDMLSKGRNTGVYFNRIQVGPDSYEYELKSREQYSQENNKNELPRKKYFPQTKLRDIILDFNNGKPRLTKEEERRRRSSGSHYYPREEHDRQKELEGRLCILDFLYGVLELNPLKRWTPHQALQHPFITQKPFTGPFIPDHQIVNRPFVPTKSISSTAESMGKPTAPEQLRVIAQQIQVPITKYPKEEDQAQQKRTVENKEVQLETLSGVFRQRNTRSQGDYIGLLPPETLDRQQPSKGKMSNRKITISSQIRVRTGSHDSMRVPPSDGETVQRRAGNNSFAANVRKAHAGEAAGGLLMMRQDDDEANDRHGAEKAANGEPNAATSTCIHQSKRSGRIGGINAFRFFK